MREVYRYTFLPEVPLLEVECTMVLSLLATESLHGAPQVRLDARHLLDAATRTLVVDCSTPVGKDLNRLVAGYLTREFGPDAFLVEHVSGAASVPTQKEVA